MVKIKAPFTYVFTLDDYNNQCVYFFRALLNNTGDKTDYNLLRNYYLKNDDYYTFLLDALTEIFQPNDEYLVLAFCHIDKRIPQQNILKVTLYVVISLEIDNIERFKRVKEVQFNL